MTFRSWSILILLLVSTACASNSRRDPVPELPNDTQYRLLEQKQLGTYAVFLPPGYHETQNLKRSYPLVVILHGSGSTEIRHGQLADKFGREGILYLAPRAPYPHHGVFVYDRTPGWTATLEDPGVMHGGVLSDEEREMMDRNVHRLYVEWIADAIRDARAHYRVNEQRVIIYGHSQGAAFAHEFTLSHPELVRAYYAFAGYYGETTNEPTPEAAQILTKNQIFPFLAHNQDDPTVGAKQTDRLIAYFEKYDVPHSSFLAPGEHRHTEENIKSARSFIQEWSTGKESQGKRTLPLLNAPTPAD